MVLQRTKKCCIFNDLVLIFCYNIMMLTTYTVEDNITVYL